MDDRLAPEGARESAALDFLEGPSLRDALGPAIELVGHAAWLATPRPALGIGVEHTGWLRDRFGLSNL